MPITFVDISPFSAPAMARKRYCQGLSLAQTPSTPVRPPEFDDDLSQFFGRIPQI